MREREAALPARSPTEFETGFFLGVLVGEGHFGGDGKTAQVTLRMHTRHERLFRWIVEVFGGKLYGPYDHGGRRYFQWMARGVALRERIVPMLTRHWAFLDDHVQSRVEAMCGRYSIPFPSTLRLSQEESATAERDIQDRRDAP